eukprot:1244689-Pleurochrysis_carterae.AAC.1
MDIGRTTRMPADTHESNESRRRMRFDLPEREIFGVEDDLDAALEWANSAHDVSAADKADCGVAVEVEMQSTLTERQEESRILEQP